MEIFDNLFGKQSNDEIKKSEISDSSKHAVIIYFDYGIEGLDELHGLGDKLNKAITDNQVGEYDGHEIAMDNSDGFYYMYGPNAERLFKVIKPILEETDFMIGARATLRFGPPEDGVKEIEVEIK